MSIDQRVKSHTITRQEYISNHFQGNSKLGLQEKCEQILKLNPQERKKGDLIVLKRFLDNNEYFFQLQATLDQESLMNCCKNFRLEEYSKNSIVFEIGDPGLKFYIILQGEVGVYMRQSSPNVRNRQSKKQDVEEEQSQKKMKNLTKVKSLYQGEQFGEITLFNSQTRATTVCCQNDCKFAVLQKADFNDIMYENQRRKKQKELHELKSFPGFKTLSKKLLNILLNNLKPLQFKYRQYVYHQGDQIPSQGHDIFIVQKGEFVVLQNQLPQIVNIKIVIIKSKFSQSMKKEENNRKIETQVAILSKGQIFGDNETFNPQPRQNSVKCASSDGTLLCISFQELTLSVQATNELTLLDQLKDICQQKSQWRQFQHERIETVISEYQQYFVTQNDMSKNDRSKTLKSVLDEKPSIVKRLPKVAFNQTAEQRMLPIKSPRFKEENIYQKDSPWQWDMLVQLKKDQFSRLSEDNQSYNNLVDIQINQPRLSKMRVQSYNASPLQKRQSVAERYTHLNSMDTKIKSENKYSIQLSNSVNQQNLTSRDDSIEFSNIKLFLLNEIPNYDKELKQTEYSQLEISNQQQTLRRVLNTGRFALKRKKQKKFYNSYLSFLKSQ